MSFIKNRHGFTMVELLVVIGMLMLLIGAVTTSVASARRRAKVQEATTVAQEMTNAILAYENFGSTDGSDFKSPLSQHTMEKQPALEGEMGFIIGGSGEKDSSGNKIPVLFNASISGNPRAIRDPWGNAYLVTIREKTLKPDQDAQKKKIYTAVSFPNFNRIPADQR